jgi:hypothetical protein
VLVGKRIGGGGFADVFNGSYQGSEVAVKCMKADAQGTTAWVGLLKVWCA